MLYTENQLQMVQFVKTRLAPNALNFSSEQGLLMFSGERMNVVIQHDTHRMEIWIKGISEEVSEMLYHKALNGFPKNISSNQEETMLYRLVMAMRIAKSKYEDLIALYELKQEVLNR